MIQRRTSVSAARNGVQQRLQRRILRGEIVFIVLNDFLIVIFIIIVLIFILIIIFMTIALSTVDTTGCCTQRVKPHENFMDTSFGIENGNMCCGTDDVALITYRHRDGSRAHIRVLYS